MTSANLRRAEEALDPVALERQPESRAVGTHRGTSMRRRRLLIDPTVTCGDDDARDEALQIPLPGTESRFVEIVQVEYERLLGRGEDAEVAEMGVAADRHIRVGGGLTREVGRLQGRGAAEESERVLHHPLDPQRDQVRQSPLVLAVQDAERVPIRVGSVLGVRAAGEDLPSGSARFIAILVGGHVGVLETQAPWYSSHGQKLTSRPGAANHLIRVILTCRAASQAATIG